MIDFSHVYKTYAGTVHALRDVNLSIGKGEFAFLTGPSGAGKSTLFKMISAYDRPCSGEVTVSHYRLNEMHTNEVPFLRRKIGVIYQDFKLLSSKTVFDNVALPLLVKGESESFIRRRVNEMLDSVGLVHKKSKFPDFLSGGEQQRVAIARALVHKPGILIADEPTGNLDPKLSEDIMDLLEDVNAQGTTIFVATHDLDLVKRRNKRVVEISAGQIIRKLDEEPIL